VKQAKYLLPLTVGIASLVCQCAGAPKKPPCSYRGRLVKSGKSVSLHDLVPKRPAAFTSSGEGGLLFGWCRSRHWLTPVEFDLQPATILVAGA
jgi:hypothetical protein